MAGAFSFVLGIFGLGAAGAVSAGQNAKIKKADYQYGEEHGLHGTSEVLQMRERVRKEWWSICGKTYNACERPASSYGDLSRTPWCYLKKRWFIGNRQISRRMDTHGIIVVERFATFHYY